MKHMLSAAVALAFGLGVAVSAQAQAPQGNTTQGNMGQRNMARGTIAPAPMRAAPQTVTQQPRMAGQAQMQRVRVNYPKSHKAMVKEAQTTLKQAGLYNGKVDGKWGHKSQQALAQFEKQHNLPVTKQLNRSTFAALTSAPTGGSAVGVGSTMPRQPAPAQATGMTRPMTGPTPTQAPGAGGSNGGGSNAGAANGATTGR
jgi:hypothetical protein